MMMILMIQILQKKSCIESRFITICKASYQININIYFIKRSLKVVVGGITGFIIFFMVSTATAFVVLLIQNGICPQCDSD